MPDARYKKGAAAIRGRQNERKRPMGNFKHETDELYPTGAPRPRPEPIEKEKTPTPWKDLSILTGRIVKLEKKLATAVEQRQLTEDRIAELRTKLLQTIEAVKRLAQGKSLGTLGLPSDEEWDQGL